MKHGKILSALLSAAILFGAVLWVPVSGADKALTLKAESRLTLDREAGCIRGIYGEVTADDLAAEFDDGAVVAVDDRVLLDDHVPHLLSRLRDGRARMSFG